MPKEPLLRIDDVVPIDALPLLREEGPNIHTVMQGSYQMALSLFRKYGPDEVPNAIPNEVQNEVPNNGFHDFLTLFMRTGAVKEAILDRLASAILKEDDLIGLRKLQLAFPTWQVSLQVLQSLSRKEIETAIGPSTDEA